MCEKTIAIPYAACNDCPLFSWGLTDDEAEAKANVHEDRFDGHDAYVDERTKTVAEDAERAKGEPLKDDKFALARHIAGKALYEDDRLTFTPEQYPSLELALGHAAADAANGTYYIPEDVDECRTYRGITVQKRDGTALTDSEEYFAEGDFHRAGRSGANGRTARDALAHLVRAQVRREADHFRDRAFNRKNQLERLVGDDPTEAEATALQFLEELVEDAENRRKEIQNP